MTSATFNAVNPDGSNGRVLAVAYNATYGPVSGSFGSPFTIDPSKNDLLSLLSSGQVYFNVNTATHPDGELRTLLA
jgi:hypothetical protein